MERDWGSRRIFFFDEARFGLQPMFCRMWALKGEPCLGMYQQKYTWSYVYTATESKTGDLFGLMLPEVNTSMMTLFLEEMAKTYSDDPIVMIMDGAGWHKSKELTVPDNMEIIFLPPYSPELNPVERLWRWLRRMATHNRCYESLAELLDAIESVWKDLTSDKVRQLCRCSYLP